jgi:Glycosyl hydrolase family 9/Cellulase N-terminal ig-like domain
VQLIPDKRPPSQAVCPSVKLLSQTLAMTVLSALVSCAIAAGEFTPATGLDLLSPPPIGVHRLLILSPTVLELSLVTTEGRSSQHPSEWDFVADGGKLNLPRAKEFIVTAGQQVIPVRDVGFRRRVVYAPLQPRDLRIGNYLYLRLAVPIKEAQTVEVKNPGGDLWGKTRHFSAVADPLRYSPVIHVNQVGYVPAFPKTAMVGYFLGSAGELDVPESAGFRLVEARSCKVVYEGHLIPRRDVGFTGIPLPYQGVLEADFTEFKTPGEYRLSVPGLGASFPFFIADGAAAAIARTYALGLYHQRCGTSNSAPFTRFVHAACHMAPAAVPTASFSDAQRFLADSTADYPNNPRHIAPQLKSFDSSLYPFVRHGLVDVSGGHHDAGDYSKYTINSAGLIHALVFSADALPGVGALDNLGIPESGDGKSDLLEEAKWEADFLAKMQDLDGGFYFLVYPRTRRYENDVLPDHGDAQIVWPKNTAATAAAVAALAQISSSPLFQKQFPEAAKRYREKALLGWQFLSAAIAKYGRDGAYQKLTHYGDDFMHDDELAWAACELFLATGEDAYQQKLIAWLNPSDPATRRWGWWRLYESYGRAIRSYVFGPRTGRIALDRLNPLFLAKCEAELLAGANDQLRWAQQSAYGTSFPTETKRVGGGGWYFSLDQAFDLAVASALDQPVLNDPRPQYLRAILSNLNYEAGCNPVNVCYITGLGWKRQREVVHQFAMNDRRSLPPDGIPIGNIQAGFMWLDNYKEELRTLSFPPDDSGNGSYPIYDRWADSFNVQTEFVVVNQARALGTAAFLMAQTPLKSQPWKTARASISLRKPAGTTAGRAYTATLTVPDLPLSQARVVWEAQDQEPAFGTTFSFTPRRGTTWIEAEACCPDGRRAFAATNLTVRAGN